MNHDYRVYIHTESLSVLPRTGRRREAVLDYLDYLESNHHLAASSSYPDPESSRIYQVSTVSGFTITWWVDHPVMEVKIVKIEVKS